MVRLGVRRYTASMPRLSDILARYSHLAPLIADEDVLEVGASLETGGESTVALFEHGARSVAVFDHPPTEWSLDGVDWLDTLDGSRHFGVVILHVEDGVPEADLLEAFADAVAPSGRVVVCAPAAVDYDALVQRLGAWFSAIEVTVETHLHGRAFTPVGEADPDVAVDGSLAGASEPAYWILSCAAVTARHPAAVQTVVLLPPTEAPVSAPTVDDERVAELERRVAEQREVLEVQREQAQLRAHALQNQLTLAHGLLADREDTIALSREALSNAEARAIELQGALRRFEDAQQQDNALHQELDAALLRVEQLERGVGDVEAARRHEAEERRSAERHAAQLELRMALRKSELEQREQRITRLVEEVQRLEGELVATRADREHDHASTSRERDERRVLASRLSTDNEALRGEVARLQALLVRARDDVAALQEQHAQARAYGYTLKTQLEVQTQRAKDANAALIAASAALNARERSVAELRAQVVTLEQAQHEQRQEGEALTAQVRELQQLAASLRSARESTEAALRGAQRSAAEKQREDREAITALREQASAAERERDAALQSAHASDDKLLRAVNEYRALIGTADAELRQARAALDDTLRDSRARAERVAALEQTVTALQSDAAHAELRLQEALAVGHGRAARVIQLEDELQAMKLRMSDSQAEVSSLRAASVAARMHASEVEAARDAALLARDVLAKSLAEQGQSLENLRGRIGELETERDALLFARAGLEEREAAGAAALAAQHARAEEERSALMLQLETQEREHRDALAGLQARADEARSALTRQLEEREREHHDSLALLRARAEEQQTQLSRQLEAQAREHREALAGHAAEAERGAARLSDALAAEARAATDRAVLESKNAELQVERDRALAALAAQAAAPVSREIEQKLADTQRALAKVDAERRAADDALRVAEKRLAQAELELGAAKQREASVAAELGSERERTAELHRLIVAQQKQKLEAERPKEATSLAVSGSTTAPPSQEWQALEEFAVDTSDPDWAAQDTGVNETLADKTRVIK